VQTPATVRGNIATPWRAVIVGHDLNALVNSDLVSNLCPPPDPLLFPQGIATDWIKPGRAVWRYLDGHGDDNYKDAKEFSRMAGQLGFEYNVIEGYWNRWTDDQIKELVEYSKQQGVELFVWVHSKDLRDPQVRQELFKKCHTLGIAGLKIDFFDHEAKEVIDLYQAILKESAENQLLVNFHGSNKPTGEPRTWPNEINREAIRGMESRSVPDRAGHDTTLPFTRFLAGHADYTPVLFTERRGNTTWTHQLATAAVFTAPLLTYASNPKTLLESPALPLIQSIPPVWDNTIVLPMSEIGRCAAFARRRGDTWFLAILNGSEARTIQVPLSFLPQADYHVFLAKDKADQPADFQIEERSVKPGDQMSIEMNAGGGFIARFSKDR